MKQMKPMTIGKRILLGTGTLCALIVGISLFSVYRLRELSKVSDTIVQDSLPGLAAAGRIGINQAENQIRCRRLLTERTPAERDAIRAEMAVASKASNEALKQYEASIFAEDDRRNFAQVQSTRSDYHKAREQFFSLVETNLAAAADHANAALRPAYQAHSKAIQALMDYNVKFGAERGKALATQVARDIHVLTMVGAASLLAGIVGSLLIVLSITRALRRIAVQISEGADQTAAASAQVSAASQTLAESASEQAASLEETSASLEEMSSMTKRNADNARTAKESAGQTRTAADVGAGQIRALVGAMDAIQAA